MPREPLPSLDTAEGFEKHREWEHELNAAGWAMVPWPVEFGGRGANLIEWLIFEEEYYRAGAPGRVNQNGIFLLGPTIMEYGTEEQKARYLPKMASSEEVWGQGWSEPNAGSDMAAIQATAVRQGDHYVVNGQKTWVSRGILRRLAVRSVPDRSGIGAPPRPQLRPGSPGRRGRDGAAHSSARWRGGLRGGLSGRVFESRWRTCSVRRTRAGRSPWRPPASSAA